jgi:hypothetical protein
LEEYPEIRSYIQGARDGLIKDRLAKSGGKTEDDLTAAERLMVDRQVSKLAVSRQIEVYLKRHGILRRDRLKMRKILEPEPILLFWLNLQNSLDRGLTSLGLEAVRKTEEVLTPYEVIAAEEEAEKTKVAKAAGQARETEGGESDEPGASGEENSGGQGEDQGEK